MATIDRQAELERLPDAELVRALWNVRERVADLRAEVERLDEELRVCLGVAVERWAPAAAAAERERWEAENDAG